MIVNHNISGIFAHRSLKFQLVDTDKTMEKLSSGMRINRASDDAAGLAISEKMRSQIRGLKQAQRNAEDGISFIQTTEGYLNATQAVLQRIRELSVQTSNGTYTAEDRMQVQVEISQLIDEVDRIASHAQFNEINMLTGRFANPTGTSSPTASMWIHIGANMDQRERLYIHTMNSQALGLKNPVGQAAQATFISVSTPEQSNRVIGVMDEALKIVSKQRADLGAYQNRLEFASKAIMTGYENLQASEARIRDTDMAEQSISFSKNTILSQAATAMLAQANLRPQMVLQLLR